MASRLNEDDSNNQNKWADIDDDDDDWAPNAITWGDGTKTTLPSAEELARQEYENNLAAERAAAERAAAERAAQELAQAKPLSPAPYTRSSGLASGKGLILKGGASQDRPALVAKPPAPAQAKSPWASLPPVERGPLPLSEAPYGRDPARDHGYGRDMGPPLQEIAIDDFSRSAWRNGPSYGSRELYNSQSGRYEPAPDRRGSFRDHTGKQPAVMHRGYGGHDVPAEPSNAFQQQRSGPDGYVGRRRASSNVSGGSGTYLQRGPGGPDGPYGEPPGRRRPSFVGSNDGSTHGMNGPNGMNRGGPPPNWMPRSSPGQTFATPNRQEQAADLSTSPPGQPPVADEVEYQKKVMREKRELARTRRLEEEAREEEARRERIKQKLEALGPAPEKKLEKKEEEETIRPTQIHRRENAEGGQGTRERRRSVVDSGDKASGRPPHSPSQTYSKASGGRRMSHGQEGKEVWTGTGPRPEKYSSWVGGAPPPARNVWGSPNNDRGLGNGTFNPDLGRLPGQQAGATATATVAAAAAVAAAPRAGQPAPIGSRTTYDSPAADITNNKAFGLNDAKPPVKEAWRQAQPAAEPGTNAGVIGSGSTSMLRQASGSVSQQRTSRFFPSKEPRGDAAAGDLYRPSSPTPPPPTMEGHPVYETGSRRPHVSLPRPHPVVKLPPAAGAPQGRPQHHSLPIRGQRGGQPGEDWQIKINNLLNNPKSPPKTAAGMDVSTRHALDHPATNRSATVSLPSPIAAPPVHLVTQPIFTGGKLPKSSISKPMAEECFEEQEMGSLPRIRLPHRSPEALWQPAAPQTKPLPRKLAIQPNIMEPYPATGNFVGHVVRIQFPGMDTVKSITLASGASSSRIVRSAAVRSSPRTRGGAPKREVSAMLTGSPPSRPARGSRGSRGRGVSRGIPAPPMA